MLSIELHKAKMPTNGAAVIALDWGTSNLRAFLMHGDGTVMACREQPWGILSLPCAADGGGFDMALSGIVGDWCETNPEAILIASGMVGSAQGWREAPYVACPATVETIARALTTFATGSGRPLSLVPGLLQNDRETLPDVIRGEETQIIGALADEGARSDDDAGASRATEATRATDPAHERICYVLPGTHSKWVLVQGQRIERFATYMTGELYAVLRQHSILGRLMPSDTAARTSTERGVDAASFSQALALARDSRPGDLMRHLFSARSMKLADRLPPHALPDYLSGLLIGHELVSALSSLEHDWGSVPIVLIGEPDLLARYRAALAAFGKKAASRSNTAAAGLFRLARLQST